MRTAILTALLCLGLVGCTTNTRHGNFYVRSGEYGYMVAADDRGGDTFIIQDGLTVEKATERCNKLNADAPAEYR